MINTVLWTSSLLLVFLFITIYTVISLLLSFQSLPSVGKCITTLLENSVTAVHAFQVGYKESAMGTLLGTQVPVLCTPQSAAHSASGFCGDERLPLPMS